MQEAIPYRSWPVQTMKALNYPTMAGDSELIKTVSESAVMVIGRKGCCMSHVVKLLLLSVGTNPAVYEAVDEVDEAGVVKELEKMIRSDRDQKRSDPASTAEETEEVCCVQFPVVFIGGKLFGGLDRVMASHITGDLVPVLRKAGALWL